MVFSFKFVEENEIDRAIPELFQILYTNMNAIAPTGGDYKQDLAVWRDYIAPAVQEGRCRIVRMLCNGELAGYFQYHTSEDSFMMEEIQIKPAYQGTGLFRELYRWLKNELPTGLAYVEAYANKKNLKSQGILESLGLERIGENQSGSSYLYRGSYEKLWERFYRKHA